MQRIDTVDETAPVAILEGYPGLVLRMPANVTLQNTSAIRSAVLRAWQERGNPRKLVVDLSDTRHLDSSGVGLLLELSQKASVEETPLSLRGLRPAPRRMLERTGILGRFEQCGSSADVVPPVEAAPGAGRVRPVGRRRHRAMWTVDALLVLAIGGLAVYGFWELGAYRGQLQQLSPLERLVAGTRQKLDSAEQVWRNWGHEKDALLARWQQGDDANRRETQKLVAGVEQRTAALEARLNGVDAAQQALGQRMDGLERQVATGTEGRSIDAASVDAASMDRRAAAPVEKVEFEVSLNQAQEVAPGISLVVNSADRATQKVDGRMWLAAPDRRTVWMRGQAVQQPLVFYSQNDERARELVITRVTNTSVVGYLLMPTDPTASVPDSR